MATQRTESSPNPSAKMSKETLLPMLAAHVLAQGLAGASLRPLAKAAGTSDRMLIYHFGNKDDLIKEVLEFIADTYSAALDAAVGGEKAQTRHEVVDRVLAHMDAPDMQPFLALWWEIVAGAARGGTDHTQAAKRIMDRLLDWLELQMPEGDPDPEGGARYVLTLTEGAQMLATVGHGATAREGILASKSARG